MLELNALSFAAYHFQTYTKFNPGFFVGAGLLSFFVCEYLGGILMSCGIALSAGYPAVWPVWLYPLYYVCLLFTRQADYDKVC
jgi:hypothetical protein